MNQVGAGPPVSATVRPPRGADHVTQDVYVASPPSLLGLKPLIEQQVRASYARRLVRVEGSSINWFGVVLPDGAVTMQAFAVPHLFFTPRPAQGGFNDVDYETFVSWGPLWDGYTSVVGGQLASSGVKQILVIPFYKDAQTPLGNKNEPGLGTFLTNWKTVISAVVTAAVNDVDPLMLRTDYSFDSIVTSSFSNGWLAHSSFNGRGASVSGATMRVFDLDGGAPLAGGVNWILPRMVKYLDRTPPGVNPQRTGGADLWFVGGRWERFFKFVPGSLNTHSNCVRYLLYPGLYDYCR
jgi:hypothetical protein